MLSFSSAKLVSLQKTTVPWQEKRVSKREKVSLTVIARLENPDEMGDFCNIPDVCLQMSGIYCNFADRTQGVCPHESLNPEKQYYE